MKHIRQAQCKAQSQERTKMNKSQIFTQAHKLAKSVHVAGDCYRVTFGAALKIVIAESKAPKNEKLAALINKAIERNVLKFWSKNQIKRAYVADDFGLDALLREEGIACNASYFDLTAVELKFDNLRAYQNKNGVKFAGTESEMFKTAKVITNNFLSQQMKLASR